MAARFIGEMAVTQGAARLRARREGEDATTTVPGRPGAGRAVVEDRRDRAARPVASSDEAASAVAEGEPEHSAAEDAPDDGVAAGVDAVDDGVAAGVDDDVVDAVDDDAVDVDQLAIPDYDSVPAIDVVGQLADLDDAERECIRRYELANRARRTILGKLDQLRESA